MTPLTWKETRFLKVPLAADEIQARGEQLAQLLDDEAGMIVAHKQVRDGMKHDEGRLSAQIHRLAAIVRERVEERSVEIELRCNLALGMVEEVRTDSGEIVKTRGLTEEDKLRAQLTLPASEAAPGGEA